MLVDSEGGIIAGHGRVLGAESLGIVEVPTLDVHWLMPAQRRAYVIADNRIPLNAGWNRAMLAEELQALDTVNFDMLVLGFSEAEMAVLIVEVDDQVRPRAAKEIKPDEFALAHLCPRCGFEFNDKK